MGVETGKAKRAPRVDDDVIRAIKCLAIEDRDKSPERIQRELDADDRFRGRVPSTVVTIRKYANEVRQPDPTSPWQPMADTTGNPRLILDVVRAIILATKGKVRFVTVAEAQLIAQIDAAAPGLPAHSLWRLARMYHARMGQGAGTADLDTLLAFAPWRNDAGGTEPYLAAADLGWIEDVGPFALGWLCDIAISELTPPPDVAMYTQMRAAPDGVGRPDGMSSDGLQAAVSNAVSSSERTTTGRSRSNRAGRRGAQDMANDSE